MSIMQDVGYHIYQGVYSTVFGTYTGVSDIVDPTGIPAFT